MGPCETKLRSEVAVRSLRYVGIRGNTASGVCVVGEAPGADEDESGIPFCGASGRLLDKMLAEAGFAKGDERSVNQEMWFTNCYKVRPPENKLDRIAELGIADATYIDQLFEELEAFKPTIIIVAGAAALGCLCPQTLSKRDGISKITQWRGSLLHSDKLKWDHYVVAVQHPANILYEWSERQIAVLCLAKAYEEVVYWRNHNSLQPLPQRELITLPPAQQVLEFLDEAVHQKEDVSNDIETYRRRWPYTISVATSPFRAISFSLWRYDPDLLVLIWRKLDLLLRTHKTIGQNWIGFDCHQLYAIGFSPNVDLVDDTMVRHHTLWPEFEHKLQFQTFQYTREPYYKDEGKDWSTEIGGGGIAQLQLYNCKDTTVTYEVRDAQEVDFDTRPHLRTFYNEVAIRRARAYYRMDYRGLLTSPSRLKEFRDHLLKEIDNNLINAEKESGRVVASGACLYPYHKSGCKCNIKATAIAKNVKTDEVFNLGSSAQVIKVFQDKNIKIPIKRATKHKASYLSVDEVTLRKIILANTLEKLPLSILNIRELNKMKGTYADVELLDDVLYTSFSPTAAVTFRSGARTNSFSLGTNVSTIPKHSELGMQYRHCIISRPGHIFLLADQKGAEEWPVQGTIADISGDRRGLDELQAGVNRHRKLASYLFGMPEDKITKEGIEYYLGKKTRHAGSYGMQKDTMSDNLLKDGKVMPPPYCAWLLDNFHKAEPNIHAVYHKYIEDTLSKTRTIRNPLGFERIFFGLHPFRDNSAVFREAYAQLPQSTIAVNNGLAIIYLNDKNVPLLLDGHDSVVTEPKDEDSEILEMVVLIKQAYNRVLKFPHGLELQIPIEFEVGFNLRDMVTVRGSADEKQIREALCEARDTKERTMANV